MLIKINSNNVYYVKFPNYSYQIKIKYFDDCDFKKILEYMNNLRNSERRNVPLKVKKKLRTN